MGMTNDIENLNWPLFSWGNDCFNQSGCGRWRCAWLRHLFWGPNLAEAAFLPTWTINDHHILSGVGRCWQYVQIWETTWETHMSARQNLPHFGTITVHQDIDTWYYRETLRNDRGDFWYTCLPDFITHIKSSGTMRDTKKTITISATSFRGCNRFSPFVTWMETHGHLNRDVCRCF